VQDAWDQYMQPSTVSLDPAANLWSSNSPENNMFTQTSSPDSPPNDNAFGVHSSFYTQNIESVMGASKSDQGPTLSANSPGNNNDQSAGEVFMGVSSPQPGGIPGWKWTLVNDKK
jgi:hypothetical protein